MLTLVAIVLALVVVPSPWGAVGVGVAAVFDLAETAALLRWSRRRRVTVGVETLVGRRAVAVGALAPRGRVRIDGELWDALADRPASPGEEVVVTGLDGLTLAVAPAEADAEGA